MNLGQLVMRFRVQANDLAEPFLWDTESVIGWLNDAQQEAAIRGRLLHESDNPAMCRIAIEAGKSVYPLHPSVYELTYLRLMPANIEPYLTSTEALDESWPNWRTMRERDMGYKRYLVQSDTSVRVVPTPEHDGELILEAYRTPTVMVEDTDEPEIHPAHHLHLLQWALHCAFSVPDAEVFDPARAKAAEETFTQYFGQRPNSDLRRRTREDVPHHNKTWI